VGFVLGARAGREIDRAHRRGDISRMPDIFSIDERHPGRDGRSYLSSVDVLDEITGAFEDEYDLVAVRVAFPHRPVAGRRLYHHQSTWRIVCAVSFDVGFEGGTVVAGTRNRYCGLADAVGNMNRAFFEVDGVCIRHGIPCDQMRPSMPIFPN